MYNTFISLISVIQKPADIKGLPVFLKKVHDLMTSNFSDYEVILINNLPGYNLGDELKQLEKVYKNQVFILNLSTSINKNHAIIAGLDRSNGDYTVVFELEFADNPELILQLFQKTQENYDIVYLRGTGPKVSLLYQLFYRIFYFLLRNYSSLKIDARAYTTRIISRRALNSLLKLRENLRYMKALYSIVGYNTSYLETSVGRPIEVEEGFSERFKTSLIAITSFTPFLNSLMLWLFILSLAFLIGVVVNALVFKFSGADLFGNTQEAPPGWTFLVILISIFFAVTCLNLYIMSIYLANIYHEIKKRPLYIIESIQRP